MSDFISAKEFGKLKRQDLDNGAFINDIWRALKNREELEAQIKDFEEALATYIDMSKMNNELDKALEQGDG